MIASWLLLFGRAQAAGCDVRHAAGEIDSVVDEALLAYATVDQAAFEAAADRATGMVECLSEPASPQLVASLHRLGGIRLLVAGKDDEARRFLVSAIALDPAYVLSDVLAPDGGKLDQLWTQAKGISKPDREPLAIGGLQARIDGALAADRPAAGPYLIQVETSGRVAWSDYLVDQAPVVPEAVRSIAATDQAMGLAKPRTAAAAAPMPAPRAPTGSRPAAPAPAPVAGGRGKGLLWAGVASGGVAAGLYGTAAASRLSYDRNPSGTTHLVTDAAYLSSIGTAALSGALLTTFLVTR